MKHLTAIFALFITSVCFADNGTYKFVKYPEQILGTKDGTVLIIDPSMPERETAIAKHCDIASIQEVTRRQAVDGLNARLISEVTSVIYCIKAPSRAEH